MILQSELRMNKNKLAYETSQKTNLRSRGIIINKWSCKTYEGSFTNTHEPRKIELKFDAYRDYSGIKFYMVMVCVTYIRQIVMDQNPKEQPQPAAARVQTDSPTPISLNGLWLQRKCTNDMINMSKFYDTRCLHALDIDFPNDWLFQLHMFTIIYMLFLLIPF